MVFSLLDTIEEAVAHTRIQSAELRYEEVFIMIQDITEGIATIENVVKPFNSRFSHNNIEQLTADLKGNISKVISFYEQEKEIYLEAQIEEAILPVFQAWKKELERVMGPFVLS